MESNQFRSAIAAARMMSLVGRIRLNYFFRPAPPTPHHFLVKFRILPTLEQLGSQRVHEGVPLSSWNPNLDRPSLHGMDTDFPRQKPSDGFDIGTAMQGQGQGTKHAAWTQSHWQ